MYKTESEQDDILKFLEENLPDADFEILEPYSILNENREDILFIQDFDLPEGRIEYYASKHFEIYSNQAKEILKDLPPSLILSSGMFGGKTTLSFIILDELVMQGKSVSLLIADVMGEDYITARSYKNGERRSAVRFGYSTNYEGIIEELRKSNVDAVFLDEFSFLDVAIVEALQEMCLEKGKNLVLTGLNTSYLGHPLPAFCNGSSLLEKSKIEECYSFVPNFCDEEPLGTSTIRYVKIADNWVLDVGLLPLVVSKEKSHIVHYAPAMQEHTAVNILQSRPDLLYGILYPSQERVRKQQSLLGKLSEI